MSSLSRIPPSLIGWFFLFAANNILLELLQHNFDDSPLIIVAIGLTWGVVATECVLLAIWIPLGPWPLWQRLTFGWLAAILLVTILVVGQFARIARNNSVEWMALPLLVAGLLLLHLAIQSPLWILRSSLGTRILEPQTELKPSGDQRLSVRDLLIATAFVAVGLATLRWISSIERGDYEAFLLRFAGLVAAVVPVGFCVCMAALFATLWARRVGLATLATGAIYVALLLTWIGDGTAWFVRWPSGLLAMNRVAIFMGFAVTLHGLMLLARRKGYRFQMKP